MTYRGPNPQRMTTQYAGLQAYAGQTVTWRAWITASAASVSAYLAGAGKVDTWREQQITALIAAAGQGNAPTFRESMVPGGQVVAGDMMLSTRERLGVQDQVIWRGVTYRIEGDPTPYRAGGHLWYNTYIRRGDATG